MWPTINDPFLREWVHLQGSLAPTLALHPAYLGCLVAGCLHLTYQLTLAGVSQPPGHHH